MRIRNLKCKYIARVPYQESELVILHRCWCYYVLKETVRKHLTGVENGIKREVFLLGFPAGASLELFFSPQVLKSINCWALSNRHNLRLSGQLQTTGQIRGSGAWDGIIILYLYLRWQYIIIPLLQKPLSVCRFCFPHEVLTSISGGA